MNSPISPLGHLRYVQSDSLSYEAKSKTMTRPEDQTQSPKSAQGTIMYTVGLFMDFGLGFHLNGLVSNSILLFFNISVFHIRSKTVDLLAFGLFKVYYYNSERYTSLDQHFLGQRRIRVCE